MALPSSNKVIAALVDAGVPIGDPATISRVIIDLQVRNLPVIHVEHIGDHRILAIAGGLIGANGHVEIVREPPREPYWGSDDPA